MHIRTADVANRIRFRDALHSLTPDQAGLLMNRIARRLQTRDGLMTFDQATIDSAGAFLIGELERLDQTLHMPLASVTWARDIDLREDVSIADETSSFTNSMFSSASGVPGSNKAWVRQKLECHHRRRARHRQELRRR